MKRLCVLLALLLAGCRSPPIKTENIVGTWASGGSVSLRLRSNGRGYVNFTGEGAGFVDWHMEGTHIVLVITPDSLRGRMVGQVDPSAEEMVLIEPEQEPLWLQRIETDEPPDLDKQLNIPPPTNAAAAAVSSSPRGKSPQPPAAHR